MPFLRLACLAPLLLVVPTLTALCCTFYHGVNQLYTEALSPFQSLRGSKALATYVQNSDLVSSLTIVS